MSADDADVVVVGSGAAGLVAAVTAAAHGLRVVLVEKDAVCGGATAWSGGWIWVPCNPVSRADGVVEDLEAARTYLEHELGARYDAARVDALLAHGPAMVDFLASRTALQFVSGTHIADIPWSEIEDGGRYQKLFAAATKLLQEVTSL